MTKRNLLSLVGSLAVTLLCAVTQGVSAQPLPPPDAPRGAQAGLPYALPDGGVSAGRANGVYIVTTTADVAISACVEEDGLSLREAIFCANTVAAATVYIPEGTYTLAHGALSISNDTLTIVGEDAVATIIRNPTGKVFEIIAVLSATLANLTISDSAGSNGSVNAFYGMSSHSGVIIYNVIFSGNSINALLMDSINASIVQSTFTSNSSMIVSSAINWMGTSEGANLTISDSVFEDNQTLCNTAGAIFASLSDGNGSLTVTDSTFTNNLNVNGACSGQGGAIKVEMVNADNSSIVIVGSTFTGNSGDDGGALYISGGVNTLVVQDSTFSGNSATLRGAAIRSGQSQSVTILDSAFLDNTGVVDAAALSLVMADGGSVVVDGSDFEGNAATTCLYGGGAITSKFEGGGGVLMVSHSTFDSNSMQGSCFVGGGGAISALFNTEGTVTLKNSLFSNNSVPLDKGGAVYAYTGLVGTLIVEDSTFLNNSADRGGAIYNTISSTVQISRSRFIGNTAVGSGGGAYLGNTSATIGTLNIIGTTFAQNTSGASGGGLIGRYSQGYFEDSRFIGNSAEAVGGGFYFTIQNPTQVIVNRTHIEDNAAGSDPDCRINNSMMTSLGGSTISQPSEVCGMNALGTGNKVGNLLLNGTFVNPLDTGPRAINPNLPASWTAKNMSKDKRTCNTATLVLTSYGWCALELSGSKTEAAQFSQSVNLVFTPVHAGQTLLLSALAKATGTPNLVVEAKVITSATTKKFKVKYSAATAGAFLEKIAPPFVLGAQDATSIKVTITNKSQKGKIVLSSVFLWIDPDSPRRSALEIPPPGTQPGLRGMN